MRRHPRRPAARAAFTLVELLVAAALSIVVMAILATTFQTGIDTLSQLKSVGTLAEQLRAAEAIIRRDLIADHLVDEQDRVVRVSDPRLATTPWAAAPWDPGTPPNPAVQLNPTVGPQGYFVVRQPTAAGTPAYYVEGTASEDGVPSLRAANHQLQMTARLSGASNQEVFTAAAPAVLAGQSPSLTDLDTTGGQQFVGRWAEVGYFLKSSPIYSSDGPGAPSLQLMTLYRRHRVLSPSPIVMPDPPNPATDRYIPVYPELGLAPRDPRAAESYPGASGNPAVLANPVRVNALVNFGGSVGLQRPFRLDWGATGSDLTARSFSPTSGLGGSDVLLTNVISFQIQVMTDATGSGFADVRPVGAANGAATGAAATGVYDTADPLPVNASAQTVAKPRIKAVQIKIRAYDTKNRVTRQMTLIQDL